ncbi:MAG TPA: hypothetical protein VLB82_00080 [Thermodesulfobacteriota bacterium]|nr:hypothetical protein [Thermodesulfobacteriota bacterium]
MDFSKIKELFAGIRESIESNINISELTERDRYIIYGVAGFLAVIIIYLAVFSFSSKVSNLEKRVLTLETDLQRVADLKSEYIESSRQLKNLVKSGSKQTGPLISVVEKVLLSESVERKNFSIKDRNQRSKDAEDIYNEKSVEVQIKQIPLGKMIDILYAFQSKNTNLKVKGLRIRTRFDNSNSVDIYFMVSTFEFKEVS